MKKSQINIIGVAVIVFLILANGYIYYRHYQTTHLNCVSYSTIKKGDYSLHASDILKLSGGEGKVFVEGELKDKEGNTYAVNRAMTFRVMHYKDELFIKNYAMNAVPGRSADNTLLDGLIPTYLLSDTFDFTLGVYNVSPNGYIVTNNLDTIMYCNK